MKKIVGSFVFIAISMACFSQDSIKMKDSGMHDSSMTVGSMKMKDCVMMKGGQLYVIRQGQRSKLERSMTFTNGTMIAQDGTVTMTNGKSKKLQDGEWIDMNGKMGPKKKMGSPMKDSDSTSAN